MVAPLCTKATRTGTSSCTAGLAVQATAPGRGDKRTPWGSPSQRPQGWDLAMHLVRDDLDDEDLAALERQFPGLTARVAILRTAGSLRPGGGVQQLHPAAGTPVDNVADGVQPLHLVLATGCNHR